MAISSSWAINYNIRDSLAAVRAAFQSKVSRHDARLLLAYQILHKSRSGGVVSGARSNRQDRTDSRILMLNKVIMRAIRQAANNSRRRIPKTAGHRIGRNSTRQLSNRRSEILMRLRAREDSRGKGDGRPKRTKMKEEGGIATCLMVETATGCFDMDTGVHILRWTLMLMRKDLLFRLLNFRGYWISNWICCYLIWETLFQDFL